MSMGVIVIREGMLLAMENSQRRMNQSVPMLTERFHAIAMSMSMIWPWIPAGTWEPQAKILFMGML